MAVRILVGGGGGEDGEGAGEQPKCEYREKRLSAARTVPCNPRARGRYATGATALLLVGAHRHDPRELTIPRPGTSVSDAFGFGVTERGNTLDGV